MTRSELNQLSLVDAEMLQPLTKRLSVKRTELFCDTEHEELSENIATIKERMFQRVAAFKLEHKLFAM